MKPSKFLLDTNIFIPVEDPRQTPGVYASLLRELQAAGHSIFLHDATSMDVGRDGDAARRAVSLSKIEKYQSIRKSWRERQDLEREFGDIKNANDLCDCHLLAAIKDGAADFLVSEDAKLHARAGRHALSDRVLYPRQALDLLGDDYARVDYTLRSVQRKYCYELPKADPIFESLKQDYAPFPAWFERCCNEHRECWVVNDERSIAALVIYKAETADEVPPGVVGAKCLKLCTFKVSEGYRGGRLGEQLLRQAMCFAYDSGYDAIYLTAYPKQISLRELIIFYGFRRVSIQQNGEYVYAKSWDRALDIDASDFVRARRSYPQFPATFARGLVVPVQPGFHDRLFPEAGSRLPGMPGDLFDAAWSQGSPERSSPSNSIRKAYLSFAKLAQVEPGALVAFYRSQDAKLGIGSGITAIGVAEEYEAVRSFQAAVQSIAKRSVYKNEEIERMLAEKGELKILKFIFYGYLEAPLGRSVLLGDGILNGPPQSILQLEGNRLEALLRHVRGNLVAA